MELQDLFAGGDILGRYAYIFTYLGFFTACWAGLKLLCSLWSGVRNYMFNCCTTDLSKLGEWAGDILNAYIYFRNYLSLYSFLCDIYIIYFEQIMQQQPPMIAVVTGSTDGIGKGYAEEVGSCVFMTIYFDT